MRSFKFLFILYLLLVNAIGFFYVYFTSSGTLEGILLLRKELEYTFFTGIGAGIGILGYLYGANTISYGFTLYLYLWCIILFHVFLVLWATTLFRRKKTLNCGKC